MKTQKTMPKSLRALRLRAITLAGVCLLIEGMVLVMPGVAVAAVDVRRVTVSPQAVTGGSVATCTVTLTAPAPPGGTVVGFLSSNPNVALPPGIAVIVPAGQSTRTLQVTTAPVATATPVTITALLAGVPKPATLTVDPPALASLGLSPRSVTGGHAVTGTITLTGPSPGEIRNLPTVTFKPGATSPSSAEVTTPPGPQGIITTAALTSSNPAVARVNSSMTVPAGQSSGTFQITTLPVATNTPVTITASRGGVTKTATLTVTP